MWYKSGYVLKRRIPRPSKKRRHKPLFLESGILCEKSKTCLNDDENQDFIRNCQSSNKNVNTKLLIAYDAKKKSKDTEGRLITCNDSNKVHFFPSNRKNGLMAVFPSKLLNRTTHMILKISGIFFYM